MKRIEMKVYTHYTKITEKEGFRWRTLLQFGHSWNIIGTAVMKNPGSAAVSCPVTDPEILQALHVFDENTSKETWYEFTPDQTMYCIRDLFREYQSMNAHADLDGIIQIFNLFYIREPKLEYALQKASQFGAKDLTDYDISHLVPPIYLGFSDLGKHTTYGSIAQRFFEAARAQGMKCYHEEFQKNKFYHPLYLMRHARNRIYGLKARLQFIQNTLEPKIEGCYDFAGDKYRADKIKVAELVWHKLSELLYPILEEKNHRYKLNDQLELTVSTTKQGFIGIRHIGKNHNYLQVCYPNEMELRNYLAQYGFQTEREKLKVWLGTKDFSEYFLLNNKEEEIAKDIIEDIERLREKVRLL